MVAEKRGMYSWGDNRLIDFFVSWVERGQVWACSKFVCGNKGNIKINSKIVRKYLCFVKRVNKRVNVCVKGK